MLKGKITSDLTTDLLKHDTYKKRKKVKKERPSTITN